MVAGCDDATTSGTQSIETAPCAVDDASCNRPEGCVNATTGFCDGYDYGEPVNKTPESDARRNSLVCHTYYATYCGDEQCPIPLTSDASASASDILDLCAGFYMANSWNTASCGPALANECSLLFANECPTANQANCQAGTEIEACQAYLQDSCDAMCADRHRHKVNLEGCAPGGAATSVGPVCGVWADAQCEALVDANCPAATVYTCQDIAASASPECQPFLEQSCTHWETQLCPGVTPLQPSVDTCSVDQENPAAKYHDIRSRTPAVCHPWLEARCNALMSEKLADEVAACEGYVVIENGSATNYEVGRSVVFQSDLDNVDPLNNFQCVDIQPGAFLEGEVEHAWMNKPQQSQVTSCEEYVFKKYWQFYSFQRHIEPLRFDWRKVVQAAFEPGAVYAIGDRALNATPSFVQYPNGQSEIDADLEMTAERSNRFVGMLMQDRRDTISGLDSVVDALLKRLPKASQKFGQPTSTPLRDALENLKSAGVSFFVVQAGTATGWAWHKKMADTLGGEDSPDEELDHVYRLTGDLEEAMDEYRIMRDAEGWCAFAAIFMPAEDAAAFLDTCSDGASSRKTAALDEIESILYGALNLGCLTQADFDTAAVCTWAPHKFLDDVERTFTAAAQADLDECRRLAPVADLTTITVPDFYYEKNGAQIDSVQWPDTFDPTTGVKKFETYLKRLRDTEDLQLAYDEQQAAIYAAMLDKPRHKRPAWGGNYAGDYQEGLDGVLTLTESHRVKWGFTPLPKNTVDPNPCDMELFGLARLNASAEVFTFPQHIITAKLSADVKAKKAERHLKVFGKAYWAAGESGAAADQPEVLAAATNVNIVSFDENLGELTAGPKDSDNVKVPRIVVPAFSLGGVNIVLKMGLAGRIGMDVSGSLRAKGTLSACGAQAKLSLATTVEPYASIDGFIDFGVDFFIASAGVGGSLNLIEARLPSRLTVSLEGEAATNGNKNSTVTADINVDLLLSALSGKLYVFVEPLWGDKMTHTLFKWDGIDWRYNLLRRDYSYDFANMFGYCGEDNLSCTKVTEVDL